MLEEGRASAGRGGCHRLRRRWQAGGWGGLGGPGKLAEWSAEARPGDAGEAGSPSSAAILNLAAGSTQNVGRYP